jgi:putative nucleotidyltransferase with HDIG domain
VGANADALRLKDELNFYRIPVNLYKNGDTVDQDIYFLYQSKYLLYRPKNAQWSDEDTQKLIDFGTQELYIRCENEGQHFKFIEANLSRVMGQAKTPTKEKAAVLYQCATGIAEGVFKNPTSSESLVRSKQVVSHTMNLLAKDSSAFLEMISLSSHDYYTYTHCVNVMTFTISLLSSLGHGGDKRLLEEAAIGAFLHDIGKAKVPIEILNKPGPLTADEWKVMKKHPEYGMDILGNKTVPVQSKDIILQHHEKINGIGYPFGLAGNQIPIVSQVVSLCDAYDAMTTNRCYSKARTPFEAFRIITQEMRGHFTPKLVESFINLMNLDKKR